MKQFIHLLKHDFALLWRNNVLAIALVLTLIYIGVFKGLTYLGNVEQVLVLIIFNDPALLGFLFIGVMVLFEKNENTLQALAASPIGWGSYIVSKSVALTLVSVFCCWGMVIAGRGFQFNFVHFTSAVLLTTLIYSFLGFVVVADQSKFNAYILRSTGVIILSALPFLGYFGVFPGYWFVLFPTQPPIELFKLAFSEHFSLLQLIFAYGGCGLWAVLLYGWARRRVIKNFRG